MNASERASDPQAQLQDALDLSFRFLGRRDRTVAEVRRHLESRGIDPGAIDETVAELASQGYLDDARYAQRFAEDRRALDAWGTDRIRNRLRAVGVPASVVDTALAGHDAESELDAAVTLLRRRLAAAPATDRERERALGLLVRRGYELDLAYEAVRAFEHRT